MKTTPNALRKMLLEIALGSDPTANKNGRDDKQHSVSTNVIIPVEPSIESPVQLSMQTPSIEDENYVPVNNLELARAVSKICELVPDPYVEDFYKKAKELYLEITGQKIA